MNPEVGAPPAKPGRWRQWRVPGILTLAVGCLVALAWPPALSEQERAMLGTWYGLDTRRSDRPYAWIAERRADRTTRISFRQYTRDPAAGPEVSPAGWNHEDYTDVGHWRVEDGVYVVDSWHEGGRPSVWGELKQIFPGRDRAERELFHDRYKILKADGREMVYQSEGAGRSQGTKPVFRCRRVDGPVTFPSLPTPPDVWVK